MSYTGEICLLGCRLLQTIAKSQTCFGLLTVLFWQSLKNNSTLLGEQPPTLNYVRSAQISLYIKQQH